MLIKSDLHIHTSEDKEDTFISYSAKDIIDEASRRGFKVIAITLHRFILLPSVLKKLKSYAKKKNVLLIAGVEAKIQGKHVLIYNISRDEHDSLNSFEALRALRKRNKNIFVIAPHPFMPKSFITKNCLQKQYFRNRDLFDALEIQMFHSFFFDPNKKTAAVALADNKALAANSDLHFMQFFGNHYSVVDVKGPLTEKSFFKAVKNGKIRVVSDVSLRDFIKIFWKHVYSGLTKKEHFRS